MGSFFRTVLSEIYTATRVNHIALYGGSYNLSTVSGTPRVDWADGGRPIQEAPLILMGGVKVQTGYDGASLGEYGTRATWDWWGYVATDTQTPEARVLAVTDLANDFIGAIQRAHANASGAFPVIHDLTELLVTLEAAYGDGDDIPPGFGVAYGTIMYFTTLTRGI